jgi:hypothetical protein
MVTAESAFSLLWPQEESLSIAADAHGSCPGVQLFGAGALKAEPPILVPGVQGMAFFSTEVEI